MAYEKDNSKILSETALHCQNNDYKIIHGIIVDTIEKLKLESSTIGVVSAGFSVFIKEPYLPDLSVAPQGRAPAVATGIKRVRPNCVVFTCQEDGDLASSGLSEIIHAANRGENITAIFINHATYSTADDQIPLGESPDEKPRLLTCSFGAADAANPPKIPEILATLDKPVYITRVALNIEDNVEQAKKAIYNAFKLQSENKGFSFVEVISPRAANDNDAIIEEQLQEYHKKVLEKFPVKTFKDTYNVDKP
ncbi:MAG: 2-oxoglutarate oxidoreductase [Candidatus Riflebacteria bacterium]|nr:2-oxoglutarate oxidoreductase [Candidatus Riflebacteria bacterium]